MSGCRLRPAAPALGGMSESSESQSHSSQPLIIINQLLIISTFNISTFNISSSASHRHLSSLITHHIDSDTSSHSCSRDGEDGTAETTNDHSDDDKDGGSVRCCGLSADRRRGCRGRSGSSGNRQGPTTAPRQAAGPSVRVPQNTVSVGASAGIEVASPAGRSGLFIPSEKKRPMVTSIVMINARSIFGMHHIGLQMSVQRQA